MSEHGKKLRNLGFPETVVKEVETAEKLFAFSLSSQSWFLDNLKEFATTFILPIVALGVLGWAVIGLMYLGGYPFP